MSPEEKSEILSMSYEEKKSLLIELLTEEWELWEWIDWNDMTEETINQIFDVLFTEDEDTRNTKIAGYLEKEGKTYKEHHNNLMQIVSQIKRFDLKMREQESSLSDEKDVSALEDEFLNM